MPFKKHAGVCMAHLLCLPSYCPHASCVELTAMAFDGLLPAFDYYNQAQIWSHDALYHLGSS